MTQTLLQIAAACLLDAQGRLLLVRKRGTQAFMLPGGKREPGEAPLQALRRELQEELGLELPEAALSELGHFRAPAANEADTWVAADLYLARLEQPVAAAAELEELAWLAPGEALPATLAPLLRDHVLPALSARNAF
ncbi:MAG: CTP pyrophosphohydrolase [Stenotrophomonas maltophilia]|nr:MAG: CTP pyrophosphohydrolase [Stenotrophomonas maltophilia]